ncbi:hypothetical protein FJZ31_28410 [Candidatus Poribacteria bacterium]|nr:hypothetical protein [Candidatus Poribacteria bacterium]
MTQRNNWRRKVWLLTLLCALFLGSSICFAIEEFIFYYDFNAETTGKPPKEPWKPTAAGKVEVENFPSADNKSVKITDTGGGGGMTLILDKPIVDKTVSLEYNFLRKESSGGNLEIFYILNQKCADDWAGVCIAMTTGENGVIQYNDGGAWVDKEKIVNNTWHTVKNVMYLGQKKYDFYYDEKQMVKNASFRNYGGIEGIDKFNVANVGNGGSTFVMYFDEIMLYEGTERPSAIEPTGKLTITWSRIKSY